MPICLYQKKIEEGEFKKYGRKIMAALGNTH
jgi:hypothetical protein